MRLRLVVKRHQLPDTALLWAVDDVQNPTISQVLDGLNEVIPLEVEGEWGLEEYVVELKTGTGSFECLHYMPVKSVLKEDDEVVVRPLSSRERKQRRDAGRDQITQDGRHIIDGVAFGGTKRRAITGRPPVVIPSRKRARISYPEGEEEESGGGRAAKALRITQYPYSAGSSRSSKQPTEEDSESSDDEDFVPGTQDEDGEFPVDPSEIDEELDDLMADVEGASDKENVGQVAIPILLDEEIDTRGHPEILKEELQSAFPDYNEQLLDHFLSVPNPKIGAIYNALMVGAVAKKPKTAVIRAIKQRIAGQDVTGGKAGKQKEPMKQEKSQLAKVPEPVVPDTAGDEDDDEDEEEDDEDENPDDNGGVFGAGSIDPTGKLADAAAKHVRFEVSDNEDDDDDFDLDTDSSSSSSSDSDSDSDDEPEVASTKKKTAPVVKSDTSSSESSDSDSDSDSSSDSSSNSDSSSDSDSEPEQVSSKIAPKATPLNEQTPLPPRPASLPSATVPPGEGRKSTKARNQRRRSQNVLQRLQNKGILPAGVTLTEFMKLDGVNDNTTPEDGAAAVAALRAEKANEPGAEKKQSAKEAKQAQFEAAKARMLAQLHSGGGIDVTAGAEASADPATTAAPAEEKRKSKAGAAANRHIFGALGLKVPKNQEEKDAISKDLMKGVRPMKAAAPAEYAVEAEPASIDESWRKNISVYRAVETHPDHLDEVYADPDFPFRQKSYISETSLLHPSKRLGKGKRKKNKQRQQQYQEDYYEEEEPAAKEGKQNEEEVDPEYNEEEPNDQLMRDAQEANAEAEEEVEDLPALPEDPTTLPMIDSEALLPSTVVAFKQLTMDEKWQPVISGWLTAIVGKNIPEKSEVEVILALRDRDAAKEYDEETGERIYGKFEMPRDEEEEEDAEDNGHRLLGYTDMMELRLVQAAPEESEETVDADANTEEPKDDDKVTTEPITTITTDETTTLHEEEPQPEVQEPKDNEPVADTDSQQQSKDASAEQWKDANSEPDLLSALDATLNAPSKGTHADVDMKDAPEPQVANQDAPSHKNAPADDETFEEGLAEVAAATDHADAQEQGPNHTVSSPNYVPASQANEAEEEVLPIEEQIASIDKATAEYEKANAKANAKANDSTVAPMQSGNYSPKFHGLASFTSDTTIAPSFNLHQESQIEALDATGAVSLTTSANTSQLFDHGQRQPDESTPGDSTINAEFSQSIIGESFNHNITDVDDEPITITRRARNKHAQVDGAADTQDTNFPGTQFSAAMDISPISSPARAREITPIPTPTSAQPPRQLSPGTESSGLPSLSQAFKSKPRPNVRAKPSAQEPASDRDEVAQTFADESDTAALKSLPPPINEFSSLKDRLAAKKKQRGPKTKILAKRTARRTTLPAAKEKTPEVVRSPSPPPKTDVDEDSLFVTQPSYPTRGSKKRQSMPAQRTQQSSPFRLPQGSQQIDLTLSDEEDLRGEVVRIPDADDIEDVADLGGPGDLGGRGGPGWIGGGAERVQIGDATDSQDTSTSASGKKKRGLTQATGRALVHKTRAERHNRRQTRG